MKTLQTRYAWVILIVVFLASIAAPLNQSKVPPILPVLMQAYHLNLEQAGLLMSVFAITGLILALPTGIILQRLGARLTGMIALACLAGGSALGALSGSVGLLLGSRVVEGVGMGLLGVVAPATIAMWFPREKQGAPMGIWATWVPVGNLVMYLLAPLLVRTGPWQSVWWVGAFYSLLILLVYGLLMRNRTPATPALALESPTTKGNVEVSLPKVFANPSIWLLGLEFTCFNLVFLSTGTFLPTFLSQVRGYSLAEAAWITSITTVVVLFSAPLSGWLSDRIHSRRLLISVPYLFIAALILLPFQLTGWRIYALMALLGLLVGAIPTATFAAAPEVMKNPASAGMGIAVVNLGQNLGILVGPLLFGALVSSYGWNTAAAWLIPACLLGFLSGWLVKVA